MDLEGRGLVLQEGLPIFYFPLMAHCHSREVQGRWNLVASRICLYLQESIFRREEFRPVFRLGVSQVQMLVGKLKFLIILRYLSRIS